ncbi:TPA: protein CapI [Candidatus Peribacteria bacterium]|nr:protein CapI [Candidatus Peribacteria bacterium]
MKILLTGAAGFIGFHTAKALLERGDEVIGLDNFSPYYDPKLKEARAAQLDGKPGFKMIRGDVTDRETVREAMKGVDRVCHLAALAGVRYSFEHPEEYISNNIQGFFEILDEVKQQEIAGLIYASSSSVYGGNEKAPSQEDDKVDNQLSLYGMTKKDNELMAHTYNHLYGIPVTGLRFFTVYGEWGRPDMALFLFTDAILNDRPIDVFGEGKMQRDFTYIDDIVSGVISSIDKNYDEEIFNLGCGRKEELMDYISTIEKACGKEAEKNFTGMQPGDVRVTSADISHARDKLDYNPQTMIDEGVPRFVKWYRDYYGLIEN